MKKLTEPNNVDTDDDKDKDNDDDEALSLNKSICSSSSSSSFWHRFKSSFKKKKKKCNDTTNATSLHKSRKHNKQKLTNDSIKRKRSQGSHLNSYIILSDTDEKGHSIFKQSKTNLNSLLLASSLSNSKEENTNSLNASLRSKSAPPPPSSSSFHKYNSFNCLNVSGDYLSDANGDYENAANNAAMSSSSSTGIMNVIKKRQQKKKKSSTLSNKTITNNNKINVSNSIVHHSYSSNFAFVYCHQCHTSNTNNNNVNKKRFVLIFFIIFPRLL